MDSLIERFVYETKPLYFNKLTGSYKNSASEPASRPLPFRALIHVHAAIDVDSRAGNITGSGRRQESHGSSDVLGLP